MRYSRIFCMSMFILCFVLLGVGMWLAPVHISFFSRSPAVVVHTGMSTYATSLPKARYTYSPIGSGVCIVDPKVSVIMYHYIRDDMPTDPNITHLLSVSKDHFRRHMQYLSALRDTGAVYLATVNQLAEFQKHHCYPHSHVFVLTADDGWEDSYYNLWSIANTYHIPFSFSIIVDDIGKPGFMTLSEIREIAHNGNYDFASHSLSHPPLDTLTGTRLIHEVCDSRTQLIALLGETVTTFIYPSGKMPKFDRDTLMKQCGYDLAFTTSYGKKWQESVSKFDVNRYRISHDTDTHFFDILLTF